LVVVFGVFGASMPALAARAAARRFGTVAFGRLPRRSRACDDAARRRRELDFARKLGRLPERRDPVRFLADLFTDARRAAGRLAIC